MNKTLKYILIIAATALFTIIVFIPSDKDGQPELIVEKKVSTLESTSTPISIPITKETSYLRETFLDGCLESGEATVEFCNCAYNELIERHGVEAFVEMSAKMAKTGEGMPEDFWDIVLACAPENDI